MFNKKQVEPPKREVGAFEIVAGAVFGVVFGIAAIGCAAGLVIAESEKKKKLPPPEIMKSLPPAQPNPQLHQAAKNFLDAKAEMWRAQARRTNQNFNRRRNRGRQQRRPAQVIQPNYQRTQRREPQW